MASYKGVNGVMLALEDFLKRRLPDNLKGGSINARPKLLGSTDIAKPINGNILGIYLHRITVDPHGRNRYFNAIGSDTAKYKPELPIDLHFLLIATGNSASIEADLISWAMVELANEAQLDISHLLDGDPSWTDEELVTIVPEEMSTEDLMRIWDVFEAKYTITVPYVIRSVRLGLLTDTAQNPSVMTRVLPTGLS